MKDRVGAVEEQIKAMQRQTFYNFACGKGTLEGLTVVNLASPERVERVEQNAPLTGTSEQEEPALAEAGPGKAEWRLVQNDFVYEIMIIEKAAARLGATILYTKEEQEHLETILTHGTVKAALVRVLSEGEECREGRVERRATMRKQGGWTQSKRVEIKLIGEGAKGLKAERIKVKGPDTPRGQEKVVLKVGASELFSSPEVWKMWQAGRATGAVHLWMVSSGFASEKVMRFGDVFKPVNSTSGAGKKGTTLASIKITKDLAVEVLRLANGMRESEMKRMDGTSIGKARLFMEPWNWEGELEAPFHKAPSAKWQSHKKLEAVMREAGELGISMNKHGDVGPRLAKDASAQVKGGWMISVCPPTIEPEEAKQIATSFGLTEVSVVGHDVAGRDAA